MCFFLVKIVVNVFSHAYIFWFYAANVSCYELHVFLRGIRSLF
jgi:hypothetical protein